MTISGSNEFAKARPASTPGGPFHVPPPRTFFIVGATATGKSALAVALARETGAEIVGADAFQIYCGLPILTAQPSPDELAAVPHHLVGEIDLDQEMDAARYQQLAFERIRAIHRRGNPVIVVGGNGLYVKTLTHGLSGAPKSDPALRAELEGMDLPDLQARIRELDPAAVQTIDMANPRRVIRAIEIVTQTGLPLAEARGAWNREDVPVCGVHVTWPRAELRERIVQRTESMFMAGVVEEVRAALSGCTLTRSARQLLGLREIEELLDGKRTIESARDAIATATAQYAKRQVTWFKAQTCFTSWDLASQGRDDLRALVLQVFSAA